MLASCLKKKYRKIMIASVCLVALGNKAAMLPYQDCGPLSCGWQLIYTQEAGVSFRQW